jgi:hypothetical protein
VQPNITWRLRHPVIYALSLLGHWEWEHEFKTCPTGERHCPHIHYKLGKAKS